MTTSVKIPQRSVYKAAEVCAIAKLQPYVLRSWEAEFPDMGVEHVIPEVTRELVVRTDGLQRRHVELKIQGNGSETRSFCFIEDGVRGILVAALQGLPGEIYHVGVDRETRIRSLVELIGESLGLTVAMREGPLREGSPMRRCPDISKARALGYEPEVPLEEGVSRTVKWYARQILGDDRFPG